MNNLVKPHAQSQRLLLTIITILSFSISANAAILQVGYDSLSGIAGANFEDLGLADNEQISFDDIFESENTSFGESFLGQTVSSAGNFDVLSGSPVGPLKLLAGDPTKNVTAIDGGAGDVGNTAIAGSGPLGFPSPDAVGEGSIAILFDFDQSEFGFEIVGGNSGIATVQFWARDGFLLDEISFNLSSAVFESFGFVTDNGEKTVAGVSIFNADPGGIGFDNFIYDVEGVPGTPGVSVSAPASFTFLLVAFLTMFVRKKMASK